jgi:hypothetical protein
MATRTQSRQNQGSGQGQVTRQDGAQQGMQPFEDAYHYFQEYARERPDVVALWCFGIGFVLGWKLKPW